MLRPCYPFSASLPHLRTASALERLAHIPFRAGVEESQFITNRQRSVISDPDLEFGHVEDQAWTAGVVAENEIRVELDAAAVSTALHRCPSCMGSACRRRYACKMRSCGKRDERDRTRTTAAFLVDMDQAWMTGFFPSLDDAAIVCRGS